MTRHGRKQSESAAHWTGSCWFRVLARTRGTPAECGQTADRDTSVRTGAGRTEPSYSRSDAISSGSSSQTVRGTTDMVRLCWAGGTPWFCWSLSSSTGFYAAGICTRDGEGRLGFSHSAKLKPNSRRDFRRARPRARAHTGLLLWLDRLVLVCSAGVV